MQLTPYEKLLGMTKEALDAVMAPVRSFTAKRKGRYEQAKLDERISSLELEVTELCSKKDLNFDAVLDKLDEITLLQRRKDQFDVIISQLFPVDTNHNS